MGVNDEFDLIHQYFAPLAKGAPGAHGLLDDAATMAPSDGCELVVTMDTVVAGIHYLADETPSNIVAKLIGSNLSDLAAMGAFPRGFTLSCAWPQHIKTDDIAAFAHAMADWVDTYSFPLLGGDTVRTLGEGVFTVTAFGEAPVGRSLKRNGAKAGNDVFVTGTIGDGALGLLSAQGKLSMLSSDDQAYLADRYRIPQPRVFVGQSLVGCATACIDISDGLIQDLRHIARTSNARIELEIDTIPLSDAAKRATESNPEMMSLLLSGGDDYELAFTAPSAPSNVSVPITRIGRVVAGGSDVVLKAIDGSLVAVAKTGYNHFG